MSTKSKQVVNSKVIILNKYLCKNCEEEFETKEDAEKCFDSHNREFKCSICNSKTTMSDDEFKNNDGEIAELYTDGNGSVEIYLCNKCVNKLFKNAKEIM